MSPPHESRISRRRRPVQERSQLTVDAIVEATAQLLRAHGYRRATLSRIAERAGVSVGSIYQYFPTKEALLAAVMERHLLELRRIFAEALAATATASLDARVHALVRAVVDAHAADPELHRVLTSELPRVGPLDLHQATLGGMQDAVHAVLVASSDAIRAVDPRLAATVLVSAVDAAVHTAVIDHDDIDADALTNELTHLVLAYLAPAPRPPGP